MFIGKDKITKRLSVGIESIPLKNIQIEICYIPDIAQNQRRGGVDAEYV